MANQYLLATQLRCVARGWYVIGEKMKKFYVLVLLSLFACGCPASEKAQLDAVQNMHYLMWDFPKLCGLPELADEDKRNGHITFFVEPGKTAIQVMLVYVKDEEKIEKVKDTVLKIAKDKKIKGKIVLELYSKLDSKEAFVSTDRYKKIKIQ